MVSMKDIAKACDVSVATVSKALSGQQDIGEETRRRIARKAEELGYMANASARALKTNRTYNIGVLFVDPMHGGLAHEFFSGVLDGIREEAEKNGYDITFINSSVGKRPSTYLQHCLYRGVDGVVIASVDFEDPMVVELVSSDLPVVTIDHLFNNRIAILSDNLRGMEELTGYVLSRGHRKLAFLHGEETTVTKNRLTGFYRACESAGVRIREDYVRFSDYHDSESCYRLTKELLSGPDHPTCIFFPDDFSCIGGLNAIHDAGLRVPDDISVCGYDGIALSQILSPKLTTWKQNTGELGMLAASCLIDLIEHPKTTLTDRRIVSGSLLEGETVSDLR